MDWWSDECAHGSSPLARGTQRVGLYLNAHQGIIPACAGNTQCPECRVCRYGDHPRLRGEHHSVHESQNSLSGSSPLARGTRGLHHRGVHSGGIIPACAGNTLYAIWSPMEYEDHPRLRGEHICSALLFLILEGSSPLARGTLKIQGPLLKCSGIIPACAGNTHSCTLYMVASEDHPRLRGEHLGVAWNSSQRSGSSPLARGTREPLPRTALSAGIIPACAGNTLSERGADAPMWDHPRLRGEHLAKRRDYTNDLGSSPLARGTPRAEPPEASADRIIPACAGNTRR